VNIFGKNLALWIIIALLLVALFNLFQNSSGRGQQQSIDFSEFIAQVENGSIRGITMRGQAVEGHFAQGGRFTTQVPDDPKLAEELNARGVNVSIQTPDDNVPSLFGILISWFPMLLLIGVWIFFMRQMQSGGGKAMGFGKSRARLLTEKVGRVTFDDVAGIDEAKQELEEIVEYLRDPQKFQRLGGKIPKGVLLVGPPGTGKTLLARAIAGEANVPFFTISGSDFVEMFVGVGASRVRDMFEQGKKNAPCIIFIDEIDAVGRHRGAGLGGGNDEREQTLNQLLVEMDGFERRARPGAVAAGPLRPPGGGPQPGHPGAREDPQGAYAQGAAGARRERQGDRPRHPRLLRRRPRQPGERGGAVGRPQGPPGRHHARIGGGQGQGNDGQRAALAGDDRGGEGAHRLSRGRPRAGRLSHSRQRPAP
jgi:hypothetical protein